MKELTSSMNVYLLKLINFKYYIDIYIFYFYILFIYLIVYNTVIHR